MFRPALRTTRAFQAPSAAPKFPRRNFNTTKMRRDDHGGGRGMGIPEEGAFEYVFPHHPFHHKVVDGEKKLAEARRSAVALREAAYPYEK